MGSVVSKMSADPRTHETSNAVAGPGPSSSASSTSPPSVNGNANGPSRPPSTAATASSSSLRIPSAGSGPRDVNALRAAALKSSRMKKLKAEAQQRRPATASREEGEISDGSEEDVASSSATPALPPLEAPAPGIVRQTVVTLSPNQESDDPSQSTMTKEEETQYLSTLRNLMEELGVPPQDLVSNGAPFRLVTQACQEIVATSRRQTAGVDKAAGDQWTKTRSPRREASETPGLPDAESRPSTRAHSRMSSPDVEVTVHTSAMSPGSDSSTEAIVERMVPRQNDETYPHFPPSSAAVHIDTYRPLPRSAAPTPRQLPVPPPFHPPHPPHMPMAQPSRPRRRRRDLDSAAAGPTTLNYGDDSDGSKSPSPAPQQPPAPPPPPPALSPPPPPQAPVPIPAPVPAPRPESLAETRRRLLASRGKRKPGTPLSGTSSSAPTPPLPALPVKPSETAGSSVEVPMDIDEEVEDGEIQEEEESETLDVPRVASAEPVSRTSSRGLKRPHAEDLMDLPTRPTSAARLAPPRRRIFGTLQWSTRLQVSLDDSEEEDSSDDECDDEPSPPSVPVIEIPPEWEVVQRQDEQARLIAEKEEHIRRLKEKIQALAAKKRGAMASTPSGALTPSTEARVTEAAEAAVAAMEGDQQSVLEAAAMAINDDRSSWAADGKSDVEDDTMEVDEDDSSSDPDTAAAASSSVCGVRPTELSEKHHFQPYRPLLTHYPQLVPSASAAAATTAATDDGELTLDWGLLSSVILTHRLQRDPDATMCAFEAGGGRCTDVKCDDVHLVRAEPTDEDMVAYISQILAFDGDDSPSAAVVAEALNAARKDLDTAQEKRSRAGSEAAEAPLAKLLASATRRLRAQAHA